MNLRAQLDVFISSVGQYFKHLSSGDESLAIATPYLARNDEPLGLDYCGLISVTGKVQGYVFFTASRAMLKYILLRYGESEYGQAYLRDVVGEVANTLAGNARKEFGADFHISTPKILEGRLDMRALTQQTHSYVLPLRWRNQGAQLILSFA